MKSQKKNLLLLLACLVVADGGAFLIRPLPSLKVSYRTTTTTTSIDAAATTESSGIMSDSLSSILKKASKTLAVVLDVNAPDLTQTPEELATVSMQLRQIKVSAIATSDVPTAKGLVDEQASAKGNFPGPCPVIYDGTDPISAMEAGVTAVVVPPSSTADLKGLDVIYKVSSVEEVMSVPKECNAFLVDTDNTENINDVLTAIPSNSVIIASVTSMQEENNELAMAKELKDGGVTTLLMKSAIVG